MSDYLEVRIYYRWAQYIFTRIGVRANFFLGGAEPSLPAKRFRQCPKKTAVLTCKTTLPDSPHQVIISKNHGFRALYLASQNKFRFFRLINTKTIFFIFGCWLLSEKCNFCPKNDGFARVRGAAAPQPPGSSRICKLHGYECSIFLSVSQV